MDRKPFKIHLINTRTLYKDDRKLELQKHTKAHKPDVVLITETSLKNKSKMNILGYNIIRDDRKGGVKGGGTAILYREDFQHEDLFVATNIASFEYSAIVLLCENNEKLVMVTIYRSRFTINTDELDQLFRSCLNVSSKIILAGNFNAKHTDWGGGMTNSEGTKLREWFEDNDIRVHPTEFPTRSDDRSASFVDLISSTHNITSLRPLLRVIEYNSDHNVVELLITPTSIRERSRREFWDWKNADFFEIRKDVIEFARTNVVPTDRNLSADELELEWGKVTKQLQDCMEKHVQLKTLRKGAINSRDRTTIKILEQRRKWNKDKFKIQRQIYNGRATYDELKPTTNAIRRISTIIEQRLTNEKRQTFTHRLEELRNGNEMHAEVKKLTQYKQ